MKLIEDPDNWIVKMVGQEDLPRQIVFTKEELNVLQQARAICTKAEILSGYGEEENDFGWAEIYLRNIIEDLQGGLE